eukprot:11181551-Lingulodinium_polyedra.AAC.1
MKADGWQLCRVANAQELQACALYRPGGLRVFYTIRRAVPSEYMLALLAVAGGADAGGVAVEHGTGVQ